MQETWKESLRQKFKDSRRPLTSNEEVLALKKKYGRAVIKRPADASEVLRQKRTKAIITMIYALVV